MAIPRTPRLPPARRSCRMRLSLRLCMREAQGRCLTARAISRRLKHVKMVQSPRMAMPPGVWEASGYHHPCRKEHLLPRAYAGGMAGDDSRAACHRSEMGDDWSRPEDGDGASFSWPTPTRVSCHQSPVHRPCGERKRDVRACQGCQARRPGAQGQTNLKGPKADSRAKSGVP